MEQLFNFDAHCQISCRNAPISSNQHKGLIKIDFLLIDVTDHPLARHLLIGDNAAQSVFNPNPGGDFH
ncbi:MAG TPA: hypothetical protein PLM62_08655, partial [Zoogloea sp.]|nr:hypothetical protein [Zoogloea sp.]